MSPCCLPAQTRSIINATGSSGIKLRIAKNIGKILPLDHYPKPFFNNWMGKRDFLKTNLAIAFQKVLDEMSIQNSNWGIEEFFFFANFHFPKTKRGLLIILAWY